MQPLKTYDPTIVLSKSHGQHTGHENLYTAQTTESVFWRSLIDHHDVYTTLEIVADEVLEIVSQIHVFWWMMIEIAKCFLEGLLLLCAV